MVQATITEKETARKAFETEVREKRAGPAMIEQVAGNMFKTRCCLFVCLFVCLLFVFAFVFMCACHSKQK
jgi:hypothetical protein